jgi:diacylglycerol kinase family enzyme
MEKLIAEIEHFFSAKCTDKHFIHISRFPRDAINVIRRHIRNAAEGARVRVYAIGGDGIMFDCLNGIVGLPNTELAVMPYGIGNDFVRSFGKENYQWFRSIEKQATANSIPTDVINCGNNCALNFCAVGLEGAAVLNTLPLKGFFQNLRVVFRGKEVDTLLYCLGGIRASLDRELKKQTYEIVADGLNLSGCYNIINIANGPYYAVGRTAVPYAVPDDGLLDMLLAKEGGFAKKMAIMPHYLSGGYHKFPNLFSYTRVKKVSIRSNSPLLVNLDGEAFFDSEVTVEIMPKAVNIVAVNGLGYKRRNLPDEQG